MKNVQVIDDLVFPTDGQDIQFAEDLSKTAIRALSAAWERQIRKSEAMGLDGTLFYGFAGRRSGFPASKRERDWAASALNEAQRRMYASASKSRPDS